jgi:hypothetical protein
MRFLNLARAEPLHEDNAAAVRLHAILGRHTLKPSPLHNQAAAPAVLQQAEPAWTPALVGEDEEAE